MSTRVFAGHGARLSRYSHLVSLLPERLIRELDLDIGLVSRPTSSYTPTLRDGKPGGLIVEHPEGPATVASFEALTGGHAEYDARREFYADVSDLAHSVAPTLLGPLPTERAVREQVGPDIWRDFVTNPFGATIEDRFADDTVRGVVATDARSAGAEIVTGAGVSAIRGYDDQAEVDFHDGRASHTVAARFVLANVAPWVLRILLGEEEDPTTKPEGAQLKINLLLDRLPRLRCGIGLQPGPEGDAGPAVGGPDRPPVRADVRRGCPARRRCLGHRRPQRGAGRPGDARGLSRSRSDLSRPPPSIFPGGAPLVSFPSLHRTRH